MLFKKLTDCSDIVCLKLGKFYLKFTLCLWNWQKVLFSVMDFSIELSYISNGTFSFFLDEEAVENVGTMYCYCISLEINVILLFIINYWYTIENTLSTIILLLIIILFRIRKQHRTVTFDHFNPFGNVTSTLSMLSLICMES